MFTKENRRKKSGMKFKLRGMSDVVLSIPGIQKINTKLGEIPAQRASQDRTMIAWAKEDVDF
jgi:hypothetical protein